MEITKSWSFKTKEIAKSFNKHIHEQLPWYDLVTNGIMLPVAQHYIPQGGKVYDIGCAVGNVSKALESLLLDRKAEITSIDSSPTMINQFKGYGAIVCADATEYSYQPFDFGVLFLTLLFLPTAKRGAVINKLLSKLNSGGALFVVERFIPLGGYESLISSRITLQAKLQGGSTAKEIINKELSLQGIQRPLSRKEIKGYEIFRFGDFSAYIIADAMAKQWGTFE